MVEDGEAAVEDGEVGVEDGEAAVEDGEAAVEDGGTDHGVEDQQVEEEVHTEGGVQVIVDSQQQIKPPTLREV